MKNSLSCFIIVCLIYSVTSWCLRTIFAGLDSIQSVDFSPDGEYIITGEKSGRVMRWKTDTLQILNTYNFGHTLWQAVYSKSQSLIAIAGENNNVDLISSTSFNLIDQINTGHGKVYDVDFTYDSQHLLTCGDDEKSKLWNVTNMSNIHFLQQVRDEHVPFSCQFGDDDWFTVAGDYFVETYNNKTNASLSQYYKYHNHATQTFYGVCVRPGGDYAIAVDQRGDIIQLVVNSTNTQVFITGTSGALYACDYARDSSYFAVAGDAGIVYIFNATSRANTLEVAFDTNRSVIIRSLKFSKDSNYLLASNQDGTVFFYQRFCHGCPVGSYPNQTICKKCSESIVGCAICINSSSCQSCMYGYYVSSSTCKSCDVIQGCGNCNSSSNCTVCLPGFYKNGLTCKRCLTTQFACQQCSGPTTCLECDRNTYLVNGSCVACTTISQCVYCNESSYCLQCRSGYYQSAGICVQCQSAANPFCLVCESALNCTKCENGYRVNSSRLCQKCSPQCIFCNNTNHCFDCIQSMYVTATFTCSFCIHPCLSCNSSTYCHSCVSGFYISAAGVCSNCPPPCLSCNTTSHCQSCEVGYYLDTTNDTCILCNLLVTNCRQCNQTSCLMCQPNYLLDAGACLECNSLIDYCMICNQTDTCQSCMAGYYATGFTNTSCLKCELACTNCKSATECSSCEPGYYLSSQDCIICAKPCLTCKSSSSCISCIEGYYLPTLTFGSCLSCSLISNCGACLNNTYCVGCNIGYYLSSPTTCALCIHPCTSCNTTANDCLTCALGFYLYASGGVGTCGACVYGCSECSISASTCLNCIQGYYYNSATLSCIKCKLTLSGCNTCNSSTVCTFCQTGYYPQASTCRLCSLNIGNCLRCNTMGTTCSICDYGYALNPTNTSCIFCANYISNCEQCSSATYCQTCKNMFYSSSGSCLSCSTGCLTCFNNSICQVCIDTYIMLPSKLCQQCENAMAGCRLCNSTSVCIDCIFGYFLNSSLCYLCQASIQGCLHCSGGTSCLQCSIFYQLQTNGSCLLCSKLYSGCQVCSNTTQNCVQCQVGYFLTSSGTCSACNLGTSEGCLKCLTNTTCLQCQSGYFLNSTSSLCQTCESKFTACIFCIEALCKQCQSGYYLNSGSCTACPRQGCQICDQDNSLRCVGCNSRYYLVADQCYLCALIMPQCLQCQNSSTCLTCATGFYLTSTQTCQLCSTLYRGCITCSPSSCLDCMANYFLNTTDLQCHNCTDYLPGCSFCLNEFVCQSCQNGYYLQNSSCWYCSDLTGCLYCLNQTQCLYCQESYFLSHNDSQCYPCINFIPGCYACDSNLTCISCVGHYMLISGVCQEIRGEVMRKYNQVGIKSYFVDQNTLMHVLFVTGITFEKVQQDWPNVAQLTLISHNYTYYPLTILRVEWSQSLTQLYFYTNNPISGQLDSGMKNMPFVKSTSRLLAVTPSSTDLGFNLKLKLAEQTTHEIMPKLSHNGDLYLDYPYSDSGFYLSYIKNKQYYYHLLGIVVTLLIFASLLFRSFYLENSTDRGAIVPHIFAIKVGAVAIYPTYAQYINFCYGFMTADLPWFNEYLGNKLGNPNDKCPQPYRMYYPNLSLASTYFFAAICLSFSWFILSLISAFFQNKKKKIQILKSFLFSFFSLGAIMAGCLSLQGIVLNPLHSFSSNSILYVLGIIIYIGLFVEIGYNWAVGRAEILSKLRDQYFDDIGPGGHLHKLRIYIKATLLSLTYIAPLYFVSAVFCIEMTFTIAHYCLFSKQKPYSKLQLAEYSLLNIALLLIILVSDALIGLIFISLIILFVVLAQFYKLYIEFAEDHKRVFDQVHLEQKASKKRSLGMSSNDLSSQIQQERKNDDSTAKLESFNPTPRMPMRAKKREKNIQKLDFSIEELQYISH